MAVDAPAIAPGERRPLFCLSNGSGATPPNALLEQLADAIARAFDCARREIRLNDPFQGGHIARWHGRLSAAGGTPSVRIEMNRCWYLADPWYDPGSRHVAEARLVELRRRFHRALDALVLPG